MGTSASLVVCPGENTADWIKVIELLNSISDIVGICPSSASAGNLGQFWDPSNWGQNFDHSQMWNHNLQHGWTWGGQNTNHGNSGNSDTGNSGHTDPWNSGNSGNTGNSNPWNSDPTDPWNSGSHGNSGNSDPWNSGNTGQSWDQTWNNGWNTGQNWNSDGNVQSWNNGGHWGFRKKRQAAAVCSTFFYVCLRQSPEQTCE